MAMRLVVVGILIGAVLCLLSGCGILDWLNETEVPEQAEAAEMSQETEVVETAEALEVAEPAEAVEVAQIADVTEAAASGAFVLRVNCGALKPYTDKAGNEWLADQHLEGDVKWGAIYGMTVDRGGLGIIGTDAPKIYETERYSMDGYKFVVPNGKYTVRLHFAETYEGIDGSGQRVFSVTINGTTVLKDFDPVAAAGGYEKPVVREFKGVTVTDGNLTVGFVADIENPEINGIEILSE